MSTAPIHEAGTKDGWHGVIAPGTQFPPEKGRYHLYFAYFCPFAHRANLARHIAGLTDYIDVSIVVPGPKGNADGWPGWKFPKTNEEFPGAKIDKLYGSEYLHQIYYKADPEYKGRFSVPVLWDKVAGTIVNNESAEILRFLPTAFSSLNAGIDLYPLPLRPQIDAINTWMGPSLNSGVYRPGLATTQSSYEAGVIPVFAALNKLEELIAANGGPYVLGKQLTEVDVRLFTTLVRFDVIYVAAFGCNLGTVRADYPVLGNWLGGMWENVEGCRESTNFSHIKQGYVANFKSFNANGIVPMGPYPDIIEGFEEDFRKLRVGKIRLPAVLEFEKALGSEAGKL